MKRLWSVVAAAMLILPMSADGRARHHVSHSYSDTGYYTNTAGHRVHLPQAASHRPAGATAQCSDGTYSFSENHRGTCSHHGGVSQWLD
jgi:hypothetical protein